MPHSTNRSLLDVLPSANLVWRLLHHMLKGWCPIPASSPWSQTGPHRTGTRNPESESPRFKAPALGLSTEHVQRQMSWPKPNEIQNERINGKFLGRGVLSLLPFPSPWRKERDLNSQSMREACNCQWRYLLSQSGETRCFKSGREFPVPLGGFFF